MYSTFNIPETFQVPFQTFLSRCIFHVSRDGILERQSKSRFLGMKLESSQIRIFVRFCTLIFTFYIILYRLELKPEYSMVFFKIRQ
jgi:hypothetical protein